MASSGRFPLRLLLPRTLTVLSTGFARRKVPPSSATSSQARSLLTTKRSTSAATRWPQNSSGTCSSPTVSWKKETTPLPAWRLGALFASPRSAVLISGGSFAPMQHGGCSAARGYEPRQPTDRARQQHILETSSRRRSPSSVSWRTGAGHSPTAHRPTSTPSWSKEARRLTRLETSSNGQPREGSSGVSSSPAKRAGRRPQASTTTPAGRSSTNSWLTRASISATALRAVWSCSMASSCPASSRLLGRR